MKSPSKKSFANQVRDFFSTVFSKKSIKKGREEEVLFDPNNTIYEEDKRDADSLFNKSLHGAKFQAHIGHELP